ncbi:LysR family transcriptional regulator [Pelagibius marinus]|uniref:LysR family transcriptional regulator n=1 Tax=Pelagibius marinus TaxID=2762760 RepID=UPI0018730D28|nr:LysR family transcriptional regulator [Pelagibius marinus]
MSNQRPRYNWNDIVYFLEVARQKSLVRAAEKLRVDHTTVSRRVRELERSLNTSLFSRGKSGFNLTETGLRLLEFAEGMEGHANSIAEVIAGVDGGEAGGAVRLASMEGIGSLYLTRLFGDFNKRYPAVQIELITDYRMLDLSRREADVFISFFKPVGKRLSIKKLGEFKVSLFASRRYLASHGHPSTIEELDNHTFVDFIDELVHVRENRWLSDILRPPQIVFRSTSLVAQYLYASNDQAIAMLPSFVAANNRDLIPVMPDLFTVRDIWLSVHEDLLHITRIKAILSFLEKQIAKDRDFLMPQLAQTGE